MSGRMDRERVLEVLQMIADDAESDAGKLDGQPFDGRTVATNFGQVYASIRTLARVVKADLEDRALSGAVDDAERVEDGRHE